MTTSTETIKSPVDAASEPQDAASTTSAFTEVESEVLRWLAIMPFLAQRELEALAEWSDTAVYYALRGLRQRRLVAGQPVSTPETATACRWFLTPSGVEAVAAITDVPLKKTLTVRPVSAHWTRLLAERMDAVAPIYRLVSELAGVTGIRGFHWYRGHPLDALVQLEGGRLLGIIREGRSALPSHLGQRLRSLVQRRRPDTIVVLAPDSLRLRDWTQMMERMPVSSFLVLERDVMTGGDRDAIYHVPSDPDPWPLRRAIRLARGGAVPAEEPLRRVSPPPEDIQGAAREVAERGMPLSGELFLLPLALDAGSKRVMDLVALWPLVSLADLKDLLGVSRARALQMLDRPLRLGLVVRIRHDGRTRYVLADQGLAFHARRDRLATSQALRRWSPSLGTPELPFSWQSVRGSRTRQLARHMGHTTAVHSFMAAMSRQARETGRHLVEAEPPHRAGRTYPVYGGHGSVNPDAYGRIETGRGDLHLFLEMERRAGWRGRFIDKLRPYLRYYASGQPLETFGAWPQVLFVLRDEIAETGMLRMSEGEAERYEVDDVLPLLTTTEGLVEEYGPLSAIWRSEPGGQRIAPLAGGN